MELVYGLIGEKLQHSLSPHIHNYLYTELGINGTYKLFEVPKGALKETINSLNSHNVKGINVTIPYKVEVINCLDKLSPEAQKIGSVNTIVFGKSIAGYNTDYFGFGELLLKRDISVKGSKATVLGTGGSARAVLHYLMDNGAKDVLLVSRNANSNMNEHISKQVKIITYSELHQFSERDIIINCTPCGMYPNIDSYPVDSSILQNYKAAIDLVYNPKETVFLQYAKACKLKTANGLYMLAAQAVAALELWNDIRIDKKITDKIYRLL